MSTDRMEGRIEGRVKFCVHFNGLIPRSLSTPKEGHTCKAGVVYESVKDDGAGKKGLDRWPCFAASPCRTCEKRHILTREEAIASIEADDAREAARPVDPVLGVKYDVCDDGSKVADVVQKGYRCHHGLMDPSREQLREQGFKAYRVRMFADYDEPCPDCRAKGRR